ncbi:adhesion G protein-coupled receptor E5 isoform X2 [Ambystoma mexicanum]|uniref:adhesion G protein-coupled receptor E5 isoform X2 n=1 Tax=Ambystoma mexicanum TaxID=8296 RepID=UPI0037E89C4E
MDRTTCSLLLGICLLWAACEVTSGTTGNPPSHDCPLTGRICPLNSTCKEEGDNAKCTCHAGFENQRGEATFNSEIHLSCDDINECRGSMKVQCGPNAGCTNTQGGYYCSCASGYQPQNGKERFKDQSEENCTDINECEKNSTICGPYGTCINALGDYRCTCLPGFGKSNKDHNKTCKDMDECKKTPSLCSPGAKCENTPGNYRCVCAGNTVPSTGSGAWTRDTRCIKIRCRNSTTATCASENPLQCALREIIASAEPICGSFNDQINKSKSTLQRLINASVQLVRKPAWQNTQQMSIRERQLIATDVLLGIEGAMRNLALMLPLGRTEIANDGAYVQIWKGNSTTENITIKGNSVEMTLNQQAVIGDGDEGLAMTGMFSLQDMRNLLSGGSDFRVEEESPRRPQKEKVEYQVISEVVTAFVSNERPYNLATPIRFTFKINNKEVEKSNVKCSFRKIIGNASFWSPEGCLLSDLSEGTVTCECNHLSSFAVLMALYHVESLALDIITKVGLSLSLVCLLLSIITFLFCRSLQGIRNTLHLHLCVSLFLANAIFLAGISRVDNKTACGIVAGLLHYFYLAAFCWMCLEGVELYLMVVKVFKTNAMKKRYMVLAGYGVPLAIVGISAAVRSSGYGTAKYCWLALEHGFIWSFLAPVCIIILVNAVIFIITVWKLAQKFSNINPDISEFKKIRTFTITAVAQLCLLGCTWIIGIFQFNQQTMVMSYLFTILNCLQGTFIFVLHCLMKKQVRDEYRRWFCAAVNLKTPSTYDKFSSSGAYSSSSQTRALQPTKESGM